MNKTLILTGWSKTVYMTAAAAALEALKWKADVAGVSMDALVGALKDRAPNYKTVFVLGVGLKKNIGQTISTLMELKTKGVRTVWLSSMPVAPEFAAEVCLEGVDPATRGFDELVDAERPSLLDVVVDYFDIPDADAKFYRAYIEDVQDRASSVGMYQTLMNAAGYLHRTRRDDSIYELAIRALSQRVKPALWDAKIKEAREDYIRFGRRELGGVSKEIAEVRQRILKAAKYERARVLILGESGTGKETVAEQIHAHSPRKNFGFVAFNCASVAKDLLEDRFFGHEKGAFTGADRQTKGVFERADHGTLFLDEIGEMPLDAQAILLRAIEEGKIIRVGGTEEISVNVRLVVATNRNLPRMVREGKFRADLYQRLSTIVINIAPLREHKEDVAEIADGFWGNVVRNYDKEINDEEFFNLVHYCMDRNTMVKMVQAFFSKEELEKLANPDAYRHLDLVSDSSGVVLQKIWNAEGFRKRARVLLLKICDAMMETYSSPDDHAADELEERFNTLARFLALSKLESEVLMFAYVRHATVFSALPEHAFSNDIRIFFAMAIDRAYDEVVRVMGKGGKLYKYECLNSCNEFMADELGGYLAGNDHTSLAEHFYLESKAEALPWDFFGKLAVNEGKTLKELLKANGAGRMNILLYGSAGTGKTSFARSLLSELELSAYEIPLFNREDNRARTLENRLACIRVCNDNVVGKKGVIIVDEADAILRTSSEGLLFFSDERMSTEKGAVNSLLDELKMPVIWISNIHPQEMAESVRRRFDFAVSFKSLSRTQREMIWRNNIKRLDLGSLVDDELLTRCAARYETNAGGITMVLESVRKMNPPKDKVEVLIERLMKPHCELMLKRIDDGRSEPAKDYSLDGLNIKGDIPLESLVKAARNFLSREDRGVDFPRMNILLWGPPGTGKSEFVKFLSCELGRRHVVKMGGDLLSKWVGGSEENIKAAFEEAECDNTILFFDEIDGLLRDRGGVERSWEVTQVNELLYRMENFNGVFIGATNRNDSLDPAVLRRFTFKVEFDVLDTVGKQKFFERTFGTQLTAGERTRLHEIENVTPGDFRTVRQRLFYLGGEIDNEMRIKAIEQECANKRAFHRGRIGF